MLLRKMLELGFVCDSSSSAFYLKILSKPRSLSLEQDLEATIKASDTVCQRYNR